MLDIQSLLRQLKRPKLLVRAARFGIDEYRRERDLRRLLKSEDLPRPGQALVALLDIEAAINDLRLTKDTAYSISDQIDALTAIMAEAQLHQALWQPQLAHPT